MERIPEFIANHPFMMGALLLTIALIVFMEYQRATRVSKPLTPNQATRLRNDEGALFIDVRARKDYESGHVPGARALPEREIAQSTKQLEKFRNEPVVLYDQGGLDAERAARTLQRAGFARLYALDGGMPAWIKAELPTERGPEDGGKSAKGKKEKGKAKGRQRDGGDQDADKKGKKAK